MEKSNFSESYGKVGFNKEAKELTYPSMDQAIEDYDAEHARGDHPQTVVSTRLTFRGNSKKLFGVANVKRRNEKSYYFLISSRLTLNT